MRRDYEVFISYRHKDCNPLAKALYSEFLNVYGVDSFRDDEELHFGDFRTQLIKNNKKSQYLVLLLTPGMLDRCHQEGDWITTEVSLYLQAGKPIIPIKMNGFEYPDNLPEKIKDLVKFDENAIVCELDDPEETAKIIAKGVNEQIRKGWSQELQKEAIMSRQYLSYDNESESGYNYISTMALRESLFFLGVNLLYSFAITILYKTTDPYTYYTMYAVLGVFPLFLVFCEMFKKLIGRSKSLDRLILDYRIIRWVGPLLKIFFIGIVPLVILAYAVPLLGMVGGIVTGILPQTYAHELYAMSVVAILFYLPTSRWIYKTVLASIDFCNSRFGRYPKKFIVCKRVLKIRKISKIAGWIALVPAILLCGVLCALVIGG